MQNMVAGVLKTYNDKTPVQQLVRMKAHVMRSVAPGAAG
jgi:hypothetical protein